MRDLALLVGLIATSAIFGMAQVASPGTDDARPAIRKVIDDQQAAWNRKDLEGFMSGYWNSPELTFFSGARESKGWQAALDRYKKNYQSAGHEMGRLEFANLRIEMLGPQCRIRSRRVPSDHAGWKKAARVIHPDLPQVSGGLEDYPRSFSGRVTRETDGEFSVPCPSLHSPGDPPSGCVLEARAEFRSAPAAAPVAVPRHITCAAQGAALYKFPSSVAPSAPNR
jgi:hypothetical protein